MDQARARRRGHHELAPDPGQRVQRQQGDRRAGAAGGRGRALRASRTCTPPATPSRRSSRPSTRSPGRTGSSRCTASTATWWPTPASRSRWACASDHVMVCEDGDQLLLTDDGLCPTPGCRPATSTSTASWATSATACCAIAGCWPRRGWSSWWWPSTSRPGAIITGPEVITRGWVYEAEAEGLLDRCEAAVADAVKEAFAHDAHDIESLQRYVRRAAGKFVNDQHQAPPHDRPRGDGGLTVRRRVGEEDRVGHPPDRLRRSGSCPTAEAHERVAAARVPRARADRHRGGRPPAQVTDRRGRARVHPHASTSRPGSPRADTSACG